MAGPTQTISFRLTHDECAELDRLCGDLNVRRGDMVRSILKRHFGEQGVGMTERIERLETEIKRLQKHHARCIVLLLKVLGKWSTPDAVEAVRTELSH